MMNYWRDIPTILAPLGVTCVLLYDLPKSQLASEYDKSGKQRIPTTNRNSCRVSSKKIYHAGSEYFFEQTLFD